MRQGFKLGLTVAATAAFLMGTTAARAETQTLQQRVEDLEKQVKDQKMSIAGSLGLDVHAMIAGDYLYNFNTPDSHENQFRVIDTDANSFTLNDAFIYVARQKEDEPLGFVMDFDFGKTAEVVGSVTHWSNSSSSTESSNSIELRDAYLTYKLPWYDISLKAGKFVTLLGYEVLKTYNSFNPNISNSMLFGYAIPFTHTGLLANVPLGDMVAVDIGVVNGWDNPVDNNDGKTLLAGIAINPIDMLSFYISGTYGCEENDNGHSKRGVVMAVTTVKATKELTFVVDADYGNETDLVPNGPNLDSADWYGVAGYAIYQVNDKLSLNFRAEGFADPDGVRTGFQEPGYGPGVTAWEITPTVSYQIIDGLLWRAEYRHDEADKRFFEKNSNMIRGQDTVETELIYAF
jgi:hypothetical protein